MANALFAIILSVSILVQMIAVVFAIFNVRYTPQKTPWICVTVAITLMAVRRIITLAGTLATWEIPRSVSWGAEFTALVISVLMASGMFLLHRTLRELAASMSEQQQVFRESLHTSKNNFQSLASLLHTQASYAANEQQRAFTTEIEQKVSAYAILQQQLFEQDHQVDIRRYLEELSATIEDAYTVSGRHAPLVRNLFSFRATPKETLYAGLVVSEAMINTYKHVVQARIPVEINLSAGLSDDCSRRVVEVRDNGPGFPAEVLAGTQGGFGTTFLRSLNGAQLEMTLTNDGGAVVRAVF